LYSDKPAPFVENMDGAVSLAFIYVWQAHTVAESKRDPGIRILYLF